MICHIIYLVLGVIILIELIYSLFKSGRASDFMYYLCRPFGIPFSMLVGAIIRIILIAACAILLWNSV